MPLDTPLQLAVFQGPLDLLLQLIERHRLEITEVSLASVADQYLQAVHALPERDPELLSEFLAIGTRLLLLKSRALLPRPPADPDEDDGEVDDLAARLEEYRRFKEAALALANRFAAGEQAFGPPFRAIDDLPLPPLEPIEAQTLARLWHSIARRRPRPPAEPAPLESRVAVADRLALIRRQLSDRGELDWRDICGSTLDELVATFLAVLELIRRGELTARQDSSFGPILLSARSAPSPA